jgi:ribosomal protein S18
MKSASSDELQRYRDMVIATLNYGIIQYKANGELNKENFDFELYYRDLIHQTEQTFKKGQLAKLKRWFDELTEMYVETGDVLFNQYLRETTNFDIDIFEDFKKDIEKAIEKKRISSDQQFFRVSVMVNELCQQKPMDHKRIESLNELLRDYENKKIAPRGKAGQSSGNH